MASTRYHLDVPHKKQLANGEVVSFSKRTTVTFPVELAELICCLQHVDPQSGNSHSTVRDWLQEQIDTSRMQGMWGMSRVSQYLRMQAIRAVALPELVERSDAFKRGG
jgi:hypothetical protein